jgi:hypothetical protein
MRDPAAVRAPFFNPLLIFLGTFICAPSVFHMEVQGAPLVLFVIQKRQWLPLGVSVLDDVCHDF